MDGNDIESRVPVSETLLFQLNTFVCPVLHEAYGEIYRVRKIEIRAPLIADNTETAGAVGAGLSCGTDSLYTVASYSKTAFPRQNLTHLCFLDSFGDGCDAKILARENCRAARSARFCAENGFEFVRIRSNVHLFSPQRPRYFSILNPAKAMALLRLFSSYYSSSGFAVSEFYLTERDLAHAEPFFLAMLSAGALRFYCTGSEVTRFEKTKALVAFPPSFKFLDVCMYEAKNCGHCIKCLRTLYTLDVLGELDRYSAVFDLDDYRKNISRYAAECWVRKTFADDGFCRELWPAIRRKYGLSWFHAVRESVRFIRSRLKIYSFAQIRSYLRH